MTNYFSLLACFLIAAACSNPTGRSWIIPVNIAPADLLYTPAQMESFELRRNRLVDSLEEGYVILRSTDESSFNRHEFKANNNFFYLTGYVASRSYAILSPESLHPFVLSQPPHSIRSMIYDGEILGNEEERSYIDLINCFPFANTRHFRTVFCKLHPSFIWIAAIAFFMRK